MPRREVTMSPIRIVPVLIAREAADITLLLRHAFLPLARDMGLTEENCPQYVAFMTRERLLAQLDHPGAYCLGIREGRQWVGFVAVAPYRDTYEITRLAVAPEYRHKGYGSALMDAACQIARRMGLTQIGLGIVNENAVLKAWYQKQGFIPGQPFCLPGVPYTICGMLKQL